MSINDKLNETIREIYSIKDTEEARYVLCRLSFIFEKENIKKLDCESTLPIVLEIVEAVFKNKLFYEIAVKTTYKKRESSDINNDGILNEEDMLDLIVIDNEKEFVDEKIIIGLFLSIAFFCPTLFLEKIDNDFIKKLRFKLIDLSRNIESSSNHTIDYGDMIQNFVSIVYNPKYKFNSNFPLKRLGVEMGKQIDSQFLFTNNRKAGPTIIITLISLPYFKFISTSLKTNNQNIGILTKLNRLYGASAIVEGRIKKQLEYFKENFGDNNILKNYVSMLRTQNEKIIGYIIGKITSGFYGNDTDLDDKLKIKLQKIDEIKGEIVDYCLNNLSAFTINDSDSESYERSNKIFIITIELLAVLEMIHKAKNRGWIRSTAVRSLNIWLENFNSIVNKYELMDDRDVIKNLVIEENDIIEWKSNFFTPIEQDFENARKDKEIGEKIFSKIINTIIGMMNTEGGNIVVGLCEHPEKIVRKNIIEKTIKKNHITFYDVSDELNSIGRDIDMLKRHIQDKIKNKTQLNIDQTDKYRKMTAIKLIDDKKTENCAMLFKIAIEKSPKSIFLKEGNQDKTSISLLKRVDGRTIFVDPIDYFNK